MPSIAVVTLETCRSCVIVCPPPYLGHLQVLSVQLTTPSIGKMLVRIWVGSDCAYAPHPAPRAPRLEKTLFFQNLQGCFQARRFRRPLE